MKMQGQGDCRRFGYPSRFLFSLEQINLTSSIIFGKIGFMLRCANLPYVPICLRLRALPETNFTQTYLPNVKLIYSNVSGASPV